MRSTSLLATGLALSLAACALLGNKRGPGGPNVVLIMTDDQGWGDLGFHGTPVVRTPNIDRMAAKSARMETFYVSPVCAPTRASLMTGRWSQRTRAIDTYVGRAMMDPAETTVAEALRDAGWATGIFGKWHLGDCYPMRAMDQGFEESLVHLGGGIGQPSDPEGGEGKYTDATLFHNGEEVQTQGYCADVTFDAATDWMRSESERGRPFFAYIATNTPHSPFHDVPEDRYAEYRAMDLSPARLAHASGHALPEEHDEDQLARIFAMITNIDDNVGKLFERLDDMGELDDTLVLFMVDNGPNTRRWVNGMRGMKTEVYDGGVRSPLFACWASELTAGTTSDRISAHVDVMPTILDACGVAVPGDLDGKSLLPLLRGESVEWPDRTLTVQAHRGDMPLRYHNFFARTQRWKFLNASNFHRELDSLEPEFELYDMENDPLELSNVAAQHLEIVEAMRAGYDRWFEDVGASDPSNYEPPRIVIGATAAREVTLTRQDWRLVGEDRGWGDHSLGYWEIAVRDPGPYRVRVRFLENRAVKTFRMRCGNAEWERVQIPEGTIELVLDGARLPVGPARFEIDLWNAEGTFGPYQVVITPSDDV